MHSCVHRDEMNGRDYAGRPSRPRSLGRDISVRLNASYPRNRKDRANDKFVLAFAITLMENFCHTDTRICCQSFSSVGLWSAIDSASASCPMARCSWCSPERLKRLSSHPKYDSSKASRRKRVVSSRVIHSIRRRGLEFRWGRLRPPLRCSTIPERRG